MTFVDSSVRCRRIAVFLLRFHALILETVDFVYSIIPHLFTRYDSNIINIFPERKLNKRMENLLEAICVNNYFKFNFKGMF